ncbi:MAG: mercuric transporter MerT family protein [Kofleriaceae bacterium]
MKIQLLTFPDCPNAGPAREALREALREARVDVSVEEIDISHDDAAAALRAWGSPTILIDGADVTGAKPSEGEIGCRLYTGGTPSVAQIRAALRRHSDRVGSRLPLVGALVAALAASACCIVPAVLALVGISGAGITAGLAPLRPYFLAITALALAAGLWLAYRPSLVAVDACGCAAPRRRRWTRLALWLGVALTIAVAAYPWVHDGIASARGEARRGIAEVRIHVDGMDCRACATTLARKLARVPGVVTADVDYDAQLAVVTHDGTHDPMRDLVDAIEDLGYHGSASVTR